MGANAILISLYVYAFYSEITFRDPLEEYLGRAPMATILARVYRSGRDGQRNWGKYKSLNHAARPSSTEKSRLAWAGVRYCNRSRIQCSL
jgi:hypothetical protein